MSFVELEGRPQVWTGSNFWSRGGGPFMWRSYDAALVRSELTTMRDHGLDLTRSFLFWPHAMPEPGVLDPDVMQRYSDFLDLHVELGMRTIPTFLVGHMSGENWDPRWRGDRDLYKDVWLVAQQARYLHDVAALFADHPAVAGWLVSNEMPIYGGSAAQAEVSAWALLMAQAVRSAGATQPLSFGDGAWGVEVTGADNGFSVRELARLSDFVGPHVYPMGTDPVRQHLRAPFVCELAAVAGLPVVLEEFGVTSSFTGDAQAADYYRQVLHLSLVAGATGWIAWNNTDFDNLAGQDPYRHHTFELHFGLTTGDGRPKPQLEEVARFRARVDAMDLPRCHRPASPVCLLVPAHLEGPPAWTFDDTQRADIRDALEQSYIALREAGLPPALVREIDGVDADAACWIVPSVKALLAPTWSRLLELAQAGATVYTSYGAGNSAVQRGPWWTRTEDLFGVRHTLRYGLVEPVEDDMLHVRFVSDFGGIRAGEVIAVPVSGSADGRGILPVDLVDAQLLAVDQHDRPILTRARRGAGWAILSTIPWEYFAAHRHDANPEPTWRLYDALAREAGIERGPYPPDPRVLVDSLIHEDGREFFVHVNASAEPVSVLLTDDRTTLDGASAGDRLSLPPYGVEVLVRQAQGAPA